VGKDVLIMMFLNLNLGGLWLFAISAEVIRQGSACKSGPALEQTRTWSGQEGQRRVKFEQVEGFSQIAQCGHWRSIAGELVQALLVDWPVPAGKLF
jgi:hypothetical protein